MINLVYGHYQFFVKQKKREFYLELIDLCNPEKEIYLTYDRFDTEKAAIDYAVYRIQRLLNKENKKRLEELRLNYKEFNQLQRKGEIRL